MPPLFPTNVQSVKNPPVSFVYYLLKWVVAVDQHVPAPLPTHPQLLPPSVCCTRPALSWSCWVSRRWTELCCRLVCTCCVCSTRPWRPGTLCEEPLAGKRVVTLFKQKPLVEWGRGWGAARRLSFWNRNPHLKHLLHSLGLNIFSFCCFKTWNLRKQKCSDYISRRNFLQSVFLEMEQRLAKRRAWGSGKSNVLEDRCSHDFTFSQDIYWVFHSIKLCISNF